MAFDAGLAERLRDLLRMRQQVSERKMFGGLAFMVDRHMCVGIIGETLMARVGPLRYAKALRQKPVREMDFTGKLMKGYVYVAPEGIAEDAVLEAWINISAEFVASLPPK